MRFPKTLLVILLATLLVGCQHLSALPPEVKHALYQSVKPTNDKCYMNFSSNFKEIFQEQTGMSAYTAISNPDIYKRVAMSFVGSCYF